MTAAAHLLRHAVPRPTGRLRGNDGPPPVDIRRGPARRAAEDELSEPAYHQDDPGVVQRVIDWLWDLIGDLLGTAVDVAPGGVAGLTVILLAVAALLAALWRRLGPPQRGHAPGPALFDDRPRSAAEHRSAADAHASGGRWSEALQERMRAVVRSLEERALLDPRPGRTADEAAADAGRALPGHAPALRAAAHAFDEVTYAGRPADEPAYLRVRELDAALRRATPVAEPDGGIR